MLDNKKYKTDLEILISKYNRLTESGNIKNYNEEQTKKDFIQPLFEALGWDTTNNFSDDEVTVEDNISGKRVDYAFRTNHIVKFYLEAKGFNENLEDRKFVDQAINYSWLKGVTWAVLTNFRKIKIFNTELQTGVPALSMFFEINCEDYVNSDQLKLLSKESFMTKELDKAAERWGNKISRKQVDESLFSDIAEIRKILIVSIKKFNETKYTSIQLEEIIQRIVSRLIFMRTLEDREYENTMLIPLIRAKEKTSIQARIGVIFHHLDGIYDSKIFEKHLCDEVKIGDKTYRTVIENLYESEEQKQKYNFSILDADILGGIYEQYLGLVHEHSGDEKVDEKKTRGIFYTPKYIVEHILKSIFVEINKENKDMKNLKILDPACGSGSFLIKTFDFLFNEIKEKEGTIDENKLKKDILENNIFGVDRDPMAIEIAQLNLFLKGAVKSQHLPILRNKIKHGNSLVDDPNQTGFGYFEWQKEFSDDFKDEKREFDIIIGNPPYVRAANIEMDLKEYLWSNFDTFKEKSDLYNCFMELGIKLLKNKGLISFIVPYGWTEKESFVHIRKLILNTCRIIKLVQLPTKVFQNATVPTCIFLLAKEDDEEQRESNIIVVENIDDEKIVTEVKKFAQSKIRKNHLFNFELFSEKKGEGLLEKIKNTGDSLSEFVELKYGLKTGDDDKFILDSRKNDDCKKLLKSRNIERFSKKFENEYVLYLPDEMKRNKKIARPGEKERFESEKIIVSRMGKEIIVAYDDEKYYVKDAMLLLKKQENVNLRYISGILNSNVINYFYKNYYQTIDVPKNALLDLKIKNGDVEQILKIEELVKKIEEINEELSNEPNNTNKSKEEQEKIEKMLDAMNEEVYNIYGITPDEKTTIENSLKN